MPLSLNEGEVLHNRYKIRERVGQGGAGSIYLADDLRLEGRQCALKEVEYDRALPENLLEEARQQLEAARRIVDNQRARDHFLLGTEYIAQGYKEEGAQEYVAYLKLSPQAPERSQLIQYIRKLRGAGGEE